MSEIIITNQSGEVVAQGTLGSEVLFVENNYYFLPENVNSELIVESLPSDTYHCNIKKGTCQYYNLVEDGKIIGKQIAWNYKTLENQEFSEIQNRIGFYGNKKNSPLDVTEVEA